MLNICGCLVHAVPEKVADVIAAIQASDGSEVHAHEEGRIVVTVEDTEDLMASDHIMDLHQIPGVITVTLTYHHFEAPDADTAGAATHTH